MRRLELIHISDFMGFGPSLSVDFARLPDLVLILGRNLDGTGTDSNGAGKSALMDAFAWALLGTTVRDVQAQDYIRRGSNGCFVTLEFDDGVKIRRERTQGKASILGWEGERFFQFPTVAQGDAWIRRKLGLLPGAEGRRAFFNTAFLSFADVSSFASPQVTSSERMGMLSRFLRLEVLDRAKDIASEDASELSAEVARLTAQFEMYGEQLAVRQTVEVAIKKLKTEVEELQKEQEALSQFRDSLTETLRQAEVATAKLDAARGQVVLLERQLRQLPDNVRSADEIKSAQDGVEQRIGVVQDRLQAVDRVALETEKTRISQRVGAARAELSALETESVLSCPSCGASLKMSRDSGGQPALILADDVAKRQESIEKLRAEIDNLNAQYIEIERQLSEYDSAALELDNLIRERDSLIREGEISAQRASLVAELEAARAELEAVKAQLPKDIERDRRTLESVEAKLSGLNKQLESKRIELGSFESRLTELAELEEKQKDVKAKIDELSRQVAERQFWKNGFKRIKQELLDTFLPYLERRTNEFLAELEPGLRVVLDINFKKKRPELAVLLQDTTGAVWPFTSRGRGERMRVSIAASLALREIAQQAGGLQLGTVFFDEVVDALDGSGVEAFVSLLHSLRTQCFVISHQADVRNQFPVAIVVERQNGISTLKLED